MAKNPGFGARTGSVQAALKAAGSGAGNSAHGNEGESKLVGVGIRMPAALHEELRRISYERRESINALLLAGVHYVVQADKDGSLSIPSKSA